MTTATQLQTKQSPWWLHLMSGILSIIVGVLLLTSPVKTVLVLVFYLGFFWIIEGIMILVGMFVDRSAWGWKLFSGLISIIAGIILVRYPVASSLVIPATIILMMGIQGLISGTILLVLAFKGGGLGSAVLGILSLIFGVILVLNFASLGAIVSLVWVAAIFAIAGGLVAIFQAFRQRSA